jgi:hypothetical protein
MYTPILRKWKSIQQEGFFTLAGVSHAELKRDVVKCVQKDPLPVLRASGALSSEFANWPTDANGILRFTKRYGALRAPLEPGATYTFQTSDWLMEQ